MSDSSAAGEDSASSSGSSGGAAATGTLATCSSTVSAVIMGASESGLLHSPVRETYSVPRSLTIEASEMALAIGGPVGLLRFRSAGRVPDAQRARGCRLGVCCRARPPPIYSWSRMKPLARYSANRS